MNNTVFLQCVLSVLSYMDITDKILKGLTTVNSVDGDFYVFIIYMIQ